MATDHTKMQSLYKLCGQRSRKQIDAWESGKKAAALGLRTDACPYPTGTTAASAYWSGYAEFQLQIRGAKMTPPDP